MNIEYLSGLIDADGSIFFVKTKNGFRPYISITMRDRWFLELLQDFLKTEHNITSKIRTKTSKLNSAPCYDLLVTRRGDCSNLCLLLMGSLVVKYQQCCLMYDFINYDTISAALEVRNLNRRGIDRTTKRNYDEKERTQTTM